MDVLGPFKVHSRPLTLRSKETNPVARGSPTPGPAAWWKLNETDGSEAADASTQRHTARVQGSAHWTGGQGRVGGALELDGAGNFLDCGDAADFDFRDGLTVSLWVKPRDLKVKSQTLVAKGSDTWRIYSNGKDGKLVFALNGPQTTGKDKKKSPRAISKAAVDGAQWHHVVGVYDGQRIALYLDGELQEAVMARGPVALNTEPVWLGNNSAARGGFFSGCLADARLYACGLSGEEIKALSRDRTK